MLSEEFDKKIKASLDQHSPAFDEAAWEKMEKSLDEHLPQKKDDWRRIFFILLFILFLGGGAFLLVQNRYHNGQLIDVNRSTTNNTTTAPTTNNTGVNNKNIISPGAEKETMHSAPETNAQSPAGENKDLNTATEEQVKISRPAVSSNQRTGFNEQKKKKNTKIVSDAGPVTALQPMNNKATETKSPGNDVTVNPVDNAATNATSGEEKKAEPEKQIAENTTITQQTETKQEAPIAVMTKPGKQKEKRSFADNLFFSLSAGADISMVGTQAGEIASVLGAGIGYTISKRFAVRTGFYAGRKIYTAGPEDYNPPSNFWAYYPNLKKVDANCLVYEIPVTVDYMFANTKKQNWFVSAGISSLLMKKEDYDYYFKPAYSPTYISYKRSIVNQNQHYFSVLGLSGGYARKINSRFTIQAEPYVKISLTGIGYGNVDLNSTGIMFTAILKPFSAKK